jgi:phytoene synthase
MQLSNIARDAGEDWSRGRLYLPTEWLGNTPVIGPGPHDAAFEPAIRRVLELADRYYASADAGLKYLGPRSRVAVRVARTVYAAIGAEVARAGHRASAGRAVVPAWRKWRLVLASVVTECTQTPNATMTPVRSPVGTWDFRPLM